MKRILIASVLALAAGSQAFAADLPPMAAPPPRAPAAYVPVSPAYNWSGFYLGINGGYGFGTSDWSAPGFTSASNSPNGFLIGGTAGFNYQVSQFVFGVEGDIDWTDLKGTCSPSVCETQNSWLGTVRGRLGFALDRVLFYGTGGGAFGNVELSSPLGATGTTTIDKTGWAAGAGVEGAFADNWTARLEYLYVDLGSTSCTNLTVCVAGTAVTFKESLIRAGVDYKFGGF
jgi:outer membrane immunogenic protein